LRSLLLLMLVGSARAATVACSRRVLLRSLAVSATFGGGRPAAASFTSDLKEAEASLAAANDNEAATAALQRLLDIVDDNGGVPSTPAVEELVTIMRKKRTELQAAGDNRWNGISEERYNSLVRSIDPWRVTELQPFFQGSIYKFPIAYIALIAVQQFAPKVFNVAYAGVAALVLGPFLLQIIIG